MGRGLRNGRKICEYHALQKSMGFGISIEVQISIDVDGIDVDGININTDSKAHIFL